MLRNDTKHIFVRQLALAELRKRTRGLRLHRCLALRGWLVVHLNGLLIDVEGSQFGGLRAGIGSLKQLLLILEIHVPHGLLLGHQIAESPTDVTWLFAHAWQNIMSCGIRTR